MSSTSKRITLVNAWGLNRGDEAMISSLLCNWAKWESPPEVRIYTCQELDLGRFEVDIRPAVRLKHSSPHLWVRRYNGVKASIASALGRPAPRSVYDFEGCDLVLFTPAGPTIGDLYARSTELDALLPLRAAAGQGIPFGLLATSSGPFHSKVRNMVRRGVLRAGKFWTLREQRSYEYVKGLNVPNIEVSWGADVVFAHPNRELDEFVPQDQREAFDSLLSRMSQGPSIVASLNRTDHLAASGERIKFDEPSYIRSIIGLFGEAIREVDARIFVVPHFYGDPGEMKMLQAIAAAPELANRVEVVDPAFNAEMQIRLYSGADFVISHRYHPTIFAVRAAVPFFCIRHQFKVEGMLDMFGSPGPVVRSSDAPERWPDAFREAWRNRDQIRAAVQAKLPEVVSKANYHLDRVRRALGEPGTSD